MTEGRKSRETTAHSNCSLCQELSGSKPSLCGHTPSGLDLSFHQAAEVAQTFPSVALEVVLLDLVESVRPPCDHDGLRAHTHATHVVNHEQTQIMRGMSCIMLKEDVVRMAYCFCSKELGNEQDGIV